MHNLNGKIAIISGGAGGIGTAIAEELIARGARVALADLDRARAEQAANSFETGKAIAVHLDVTQPESWLAARDEVERQLGPCDIVVSNAGVSYTGTLDTIEPEAWRWVYEVNLMGSLHAVRTFLPGMKARGTDGHVVLTSSITALHPFPTQGAYTTSKAALLNFATVLKQELKDTRIGVSAVCPGIVATELRTNAEAARPELLKETIAPPAPLSTKTGMDPKFIGKTVVDAILTDQFFVFTHSDYSESIRTDRDLMLAAMQKTADPSYRDSELFLEPLPR